jgi:hypothetical protein
VLYFFEDRGPPDGEVACARNKAHGRRDKRSLSEMNSEYQASTASSFFQNIANKTNEFYSKSFPIS